MGLGGGVACHVPLHVGFILYDHVTEVALNSALVLSPVVPVWGGVKGRGR